ncbi:MAG TPA: hypothetical protein VKX25_03320 [Bryobacteraceae bacterium]|jgi:hypothetical protein|nr:hypothetical protein [Bryobacteraceae bacterium]
MTNEVPPGAAEERMRRFSRASVWSLRLVVLATIFTANMPGFEDTPPASPTEGHERVLFLVPAFDITNRENPEPYTAEEKLALSLRMGLDPFMWVSAGVNAALSQRANQFPQYGQGMQGFGRRYGAAMLDTVNGGLASTAFRMALHQDPRFHRLGHGNVMHRMAYALSQEFWTRGDNGTRQFNWSKILGTLSSSALANAYYPPAQRGLGLTMNRFGMNLMWDPTGLLTDEFWPDMQRKLARTLHTRRRHE